MLSRVHARASAALLTSALAALTRHEALSGVPAAWFGKVCQRGRFGRRRRSGVALRQTLPTRPGGETFGLARTHHPRDEDDEGHADPDANNNSKIRHMQSPLILTITARSEVNDATRSRSIRSRRPA